MLRHFSMGQSVCVLLLTWAASTLTADEISEFIAKVEAAPAWALLNEDKLKKHAHAINEIGKEFQKLPLDQAQEIIKRLQARAYAKKNQAIRSLK